VVDAGLVELARLILAHASKMETMSMSLPSTPVPGRMLPP